MKFSIKDLETADLVLFTEETLNGKLHFLCNAVSASDELQDFFLFFV